VIAASLIKREKKSRRVMSWLGIGISSAYMIFTLYHKWQMDKIFARSLAEQGIEVKRFMAAPTILNNFLWQGVAEGDTAYYHGFYSFFDPEPRVQIFNVLPKNHDLIAPYQGDRVIRILRWFSKGYFNVIVREDGGLQFNDLRYGTTEENFEKEYYYVFKFLLQQKPDGTLTAHQVREYHRITGKAVRKLYQRIMGQSLQAGR
jgi:inner membrane protein